MADEQATLGSFADDETEGDVAEHSEEADDSSGERSDTAGEASHAGAADEEVDLSDDGRVCPWCLAPADQFIETGLTGLACGRCSATLPAGSDWFRDRDVVARRPMYEVERFPE
ncbi:MAG: hypothetical protein ABEJ05_01790 [Haloglomus sp.]